MFLSKLAWVDHIVLIEVEIVEVGSDLWVFEKAGHVVVVKRHVERSVLCVVLIGVHRLRANVLVVSHINYESLLKQNIMCFGGLC